MPIRLLRRNIQKASASRTFFAVCCIACFVIGIAEYRVFQRNSGKREDSYRNALIKTGELLRLAICEIQRLSYMLMINTDVQAFIMQNGIEPGSPDIQTLINAQRQLTCIKSVHPAIDAVYLYSGKSDYLLEADNAFFDIDAMYTAMFAFQGLNSGQWRDRYLRPVRVNAWLPESAVFSKGIWKNLLVFEQTFPLQNTAANAGKLILLLRASYFESLFSSLLTAGETVLCLIDNQKRTLFIRPNGSAEIEKSAAVIQSVVPLIPSVPKLSSDGSMETEPLIVSRQINGKPYSIFVQPIRGTDTAFIVTVPRTALLRHILTVRFIAAAVLMLLLLFFIVYRLCCTVQLPFRVRNEDPLSAFSASSADEPCGQRINGMEVGCREKDAVLIRHITEYIEHSYADPLLNLAQMASDFGITENFLYYFFRSRLQKSFAQYLEDKRLEKAYALIETNMKEPFTLLAERCGYANVQTFRRAFKKRYGVTPSEFRRQCFIRTEGLIPAGPRLRSAPGYEDIKP